MSGEQRREALRRDISRAAPAPERTRTGVVHPRAQDRRHELSGCSRRRRAARSQRRPTRRGTGANSVNTPLQLGRWATGWREASADAKADVRRHRRGVRWQLHQRDHRARHQREYQSASTRTTAASARCASREEESRGEARSARERTYTPQHDFDALDRCERRVSPRLAADRAARCRVFRPLAETSFHAGVHQKGCLPNMHCRELSSTGASPPRCAASTSTSSSRDRRRAQPLRLPREPLPLRAEGDARLGASAGRSERHHVGRLRKRDDGPTRSVRAAKHVVGLRSASTGSTRRCASAPSKRTCASASRATTPSTPLQQLLGRPSIRLVIVPRWAWLRTEHRQHDARARLTRA